MLNSRNYADGRHPDIIYDESLAALGLVRNEVLENLLKAKGMVGESSDDNGIGVFIDELTFRRAIELPFIDNVTLNGTASITDEPQDDEEKGKIYQISITSFDGIEPHPSFSHRKIYGTPPDMYVHTFIWRGTRYYTQTMQELRITVR